MRFVWLLNARAPHRSKFYSTQLRTACLWLNQQAGKTNLKKTNIGDIKHKWEYIFSIAGAFLDQEPWRRIYWTLGEFFRQNL